MEPLELLTFNIRGKDVSQWAKKGFTRKEKFARIAAMVGSHRPNVVTLQEVPADKAGLMAGLMEEEGYTELCSAPSTSSSGGTFIYYEDNLVDAAGLPEVGPVALARIRRLRLASDSTVDVFLAACHLSHGRGEGASERRRDQLAAALAALPEGCLVVVAGDMNLRGEREDRLGVQPLQLQLLPKGLHPARSRWLVVELLDCLALTEVPSTWHANKWGPWLINLAMACLACACPFVAQWSGWAWRTLLCRRGAQRRSIHGTHSTIATTATVSQSRMAPAALTCAAVHATQPPALVRGCCISGVAGCVQNGSPIIKQIARSGPTTSAPLLLSSLAGAGQKFKRERYDRVLLRGGLRATSLKLIGNVPVTPAQPNGQGQVDCLSDHFGLLCKIGLRGSSHTSLRI